MASHDCRKGKGSLSQNRRMMKRKKLTQAYKKFNLNKGQSDK